MLLITFALALPLIIPMPNIEPTDTWVVDTGIPNLLAIITRKLVTRFAEKP
jgi:hypothetical protein